MAGTITLFDALEKLGLKLDPVEVPVPVLVVDSVNQKPTDNPSGVAASIPAPPPMEFDVAEIKLSPPDLPTNIRLLPGGRIDAQGVTMKMLMQVAWDITTDDLLSGAPKWFDETKYALVAKTSTAVSGPANNPNVDIDDLKAMLRALVTERFKLKAHFEDRPVTAYTLLVDKPKMARADPANRTGWKEGPAPDQKDQRNAILARMVTAKNMTMAEFAEDLQRMASGYIRVPVEDATHLDGAYDFTLTFTPIGLLNGPGGGRGGDAPQAAAPGAAGAALDPSTNSSASNSRCASVRCRSWSSSTSRRNRRITEPSRSLLSQTLLQRPRAANRRRIEQRLRNHRVPFFASTCLSSQAITKSAS
jgi:uncharacterized protein (TIGR03435 family)